MSPEDKEAARIEADLLAEEAGAAPINYGSTAKAIAALEKRIAHLKVRIARIDANELPLTAERITLSRDFTKAVSQLANYRAQQESRN